ncbi:hypothetical protein Y032_0336g2886 [Ancylostoma ceylanicum]|uniref:Nematode cuticle collagen N-terminal domain-containing protein n=1 Tax=Ancylostoma ceylanicum TaxID=53326 RepID=A0A016RYM8_9BILA|nr:hypothetical protein Y032_0336g2886 [Ancylostoma ceylanicum]
MNASMLMTAAATASAVAIVVCLFSAAYMFADMNNFYDDAMREMLEFRDLDVKDVEDVAEYVLEEVAAHLEAAEWAAAVE